MPETTGNDLAADARRYLEATAQTLAALAAAEVDRLAAVSALLANRLRAGWASGRIGVCEQPSNT